MPVVQHFHLQVNDCVYVPSRPPKLPDYVRVHMSANHTSFPSNLRPGLPLLKYYPSLGLCLAHRILLPKVSTHFFPCLHRSTLTRFLAAVGRFSTIDLSRNRYLLDQLLDTSTSLSWTGQALNTGRIEFIMADVDMTDAPGPAIASRKTDGNDGKAVETKKRFEVKKVRRHGPAC